MNDKAMMTCVSCGTRIASRGSPWLICFAPSLDAHGTLVDALDAVASICVWCVLTTVPVEALVELANRHGFRDVPNPDVSDIIAIICHVCKGARTIDADIGPTRCSACDGTGKRLNPRNRPLPGVGEALVRSPSCPTCRGEAGILCFTCWRTL